MWKLAIVLAIGILIGALATLTVTSQTWLTESIRTNRNWKDARDWLGALSGWAGFVAALISLPFLAAQAFGSSQANTVCHR